MVIAWLTIETRDALILRNLFLWLGIWVTAILIHFPLTKGFALHSAALSMVTYSAFAFVAVIPVRYLNNPSLLDKMLSIIRWGVVIEGLWGITQALNGVLVNGRFDVANGDRVEGTIHPALAPELSFSNPMFAVNMALLLLALLPSLVIYKQGRLAFLIGVLALIFASVMHVLILLVVAFLTALLFFYPAILRRRTGCLLVAGFLVASFGAYNLLSTNFGTISSFARATLRAETPRALVLLRVIEEMPDENPTMPFIGLGPGQFSSRAGLIGTGLYFGGPQNPRPLPLLPSGMSEAFAYNVYDLWVTYAHRPGFKSSTVMPFFSWLSVYAEWGIIVLLSIFGFATFICVQIKKVIQTPRERILAIAFGASLFLLLLLGIQENYWEVPQATLLGIMILKVQYANLILPVRSLDL